MSVAKVATAATSLTLVGGASFGTSVVLTSGPTGMPYLHFLFEDSNYKTKKENNYKDKYGETYGRYLVGVFTSNIKWGTKSNDRWWTWSFNNRYTPNASAVKDKFSEVTNEEDLKNKCAEAYKASPVSGGDIVTNESTSDLQNKFLESNIWFFCSPAEEKIKSVAEEGNDGEFTAKNVYISTEEIKKDLVSTISSSKGNKWFWDLQKDRYEYVTDKGEARIDSSDIKEWCKQSYKEKDLGDIYYEENILLWCSLSGTQPNE